MFSYPYSVHSQPQTTFGPLFRLLEDFDNYSQNNQQQQQGGQRQTLRTFQPKFDIAEHADSYELHGELPGIDQKDVEIEFTDRQTLSIRGRTERQYTSGPNEDSNSHKATVEDVQDDDDSAAAKHKTVAKKATGEVAKPSAPQTKYWVSERTVGSFARSFSFPDSIDQDAVKASMKNGILSIVVPKAKKHESRKITIS